MKIKDICTSVTDGSHNPPQGIEKSNHMMLSSKNIFDDEITFDEPRFLSETDFEREHKRTNVAASDVLLTIVGTVGRTAVVNEDMPVFTLQRSVAVLHPKNDVCLPRFLMYALMGRRTYIENIAKGVAQKGIYLKDVSDIDIRIPSISNQKLIISKLDKVNSIIKLRKEELCALDHIVKSRFIELFGSEREFGRWPCCNIGDVAEVCVGVVIKPTQYYTEKGIPAFRSLNIGMMKVKDSDWVYFTEEGHKKNQKSVVRANDVLIVRSGAPGTACVATEKYDGYNAVDIIIAHPDQGKVNSVFLAAFTNMPHGMNQIKGGTGGAAQQHFNVGRYKAMTLIMPPLELQQQFAAFVAQVDKSKLAVQKSLQELEMLKKSLMQKYFG